jgi:RNA polymerase sigma-70 factor (ECF subfamily)
MDEALQHSLERQAVDKCRAGDKDEFHVIVSLHSTAMFRTAYGITGDYAQAEDAVQDAFVRAWKKFNQYEDKIVSHVVYETEVEAAAEMERLITESLEK